MGRYVKSHRRPAAGLFRAQLQKIDPGIEVIDPQQSPIDLQQADPDEPVLH